MIDVYEVFCVIGGAVVTFVSGFGYTLKKISDLKVNHMQLLGEAERRYNEVKASKHQLSTDYDQLKAEFQQLADEHQKEAQKYDELFLKHEELKEKHAPFASLNPFEQQAVSAMTDQSVYNEWLNGASKEVK